MSEWTPCHYINQSFIPELANKGHKPYLVTYYTGKCTKPQIDVTWIRNGKVGNRKYSVITAYMAIPRPYYDMNDMSDMNDMNDMSDMSDMNDMNDMSDMSDMNDMSDMSDMNRCANNNQSR